MAKGEVAKALLQEIETAKQNYYRQVIATVSEGIWTGQKLTIVRSQRQIPAPEKLQ